MKSARYSVKNRIIRVVIISCKISFLVLFIDLSDRISRIHFKELIIKIHTGGKLLSLKG